MQITYYVKNVYGNDRLYIADEEKAHAIALLTGSKTLSQQHIEGLQALGYTLTEVIAPRSK